MLSKPEERRIYAEDVVVTGKKVETVVNLRLVAAVISAIPRRYPRFGRVGQSPCEGLGQQNHHCPPGLSKETLERFLS